MMPRSVTFLVLISLVLSACGKQATPTTTPPPSTTNSTDQTSLPVSTITTAPGGPTAISTFADTPIASTPLPTNEPGCTDSAKFVSDVTVPDGTTLDQGVTYTKIWRISNSGTCAWNPNYSIVYSSGEQSGAPDSIPLTYTPPGKTLDISVSLTTPTKKGTANTFFELHNQSGGIVSIDGGSFLYVSVFVSTNAAPTASTGSATTQPGATASAGSACPYTTDAAKVTDTINAINSYRTKNGLPALAINSLLTQAAQTHAADMACNNLFVHTGSDGSSPESRVAKTGYAASSITENIYGSFPPLSGQGVVSWWATDQTDPRHNENLISTKYTQVGAAYAFHNNFGYYVVVFASP